jgi:hypothetical protein
MDALDDFDIDRKSKQWQTGSFCFGKASVFPKKQYL